ncbi:MAG TPA: biotin transporter BioY [Gemmatimonadales bacterium]
MPTDLSVAAAAGARATPLRRGLAVALGALVVALAAQVAVPVPLSPVPMTLQPLAVLVVGAALGARAGAAALILYLVLGLLGLPVFAGGAAGPARLLGPTGGYLLAFPVAAGLCGYLVGRLPTLGRTLLATAAGMVVIHLGGVAQLALLGGDPALAFRVGFVPFLTGDLLKIGLATAAIVALGGRFRGLR